MRTRTIARSAEAEEVALRRRLAREVGAVEVSGGRRPASARAWRDEESWGERQERDYEGADHRSRSKLGEISTTHHLEIDL
jgi:hypothetical protein